MKFAFDESPPPYSAVVASPPVVSFESPDAALPFGRSHRLAAKILVLVSEGKALDARFKSICDAAGAEFEHQQPALALSKRFETLVWESKDVAGSALIALKDFNEIVLNFLSRSDVAVEDRLKELGNTHKLSQRQRESAANNKSSFDAFVKEVEEFHRMIRAKSDALNPKRRRPNHSGERETRGVRPSRKTRSPLVMPPTEPSNALCIFNASIGATPRNCMSSTLQFERAQEKNRSVHGALETMRGVPNALERKRICPSIKRTTSVDSLPDVMGTLLRDLCAFTSRIDVFSTVYFELEREQGIFILHLKDGLSVGSQGYRNEVNRFRRQIPSVCNALDAYNKGRAA